MKNGVPFDVAFEMDDVDRFAWSVVLGELDGSEFDWGRGEWKKS